MKSETITIDDVKYIRADQVQATSTPSTEGFPYVIIRTYSAGVFAGYLKSRNSTLAGIEVELINARRLWYWEGAASLSQLAMEGTSKPSGCKFPCEVNSIELVAIEIIPTTEKARLSIKEVKEWKS